MENNRNKTNKQKQTSIENNLNSIGRAYLLAIINQDLPELPVSGDSHSNDLIHPNIQHICSRWHCNYLGKSIENRFITTKQCATLRNCPSWEISPILTYFLNTLSEKVSKVGGTCDCGDSFLTLSRIWQILSRRLWKHSDKKSKHSHVIYDRNVLLK